MVNRWKNAARELVPLLLASGIALGVIYPQLSSFLSPFVFTALFLLMTFTLVIVTDRPIAILTNPEPSVWGIMLWQMAFIPLLVVLFGWMTKLPSDLHLMLLATATSASVFAAPTMAHLFRLNSRLPVNGMIVSTFLMPVALVMFGETLEGDGLAISMSQFAWRVGVFLILPLGFSVFINRFVGVLPECRKPQIYKWLRVGAVAALMIFGVGIMDGVADKIATDPDRVLTFLLLAVAFSVATVVGTVVLFWSLGRDLVLAATILSVHRNVGLTYAVIGTTAGNDFAIYIAICQVPLFLSPLLIRFIQALSMIVRGSRVGTSRAT